MNVTKAFYTNRKGQKIEVIVVEKAAPHVDANGVHPAWRVRKSTNQNPLYTFTVKESELSGAFREVHIINPVKMWSPTSGNCQKPREGAR